MAKKKKRGYSGKKNKRVRRPFDPKVLNRHHILWVASTWDSAGQYAHLLRHHEYMIKPVPRDTLHMEIHMTIGHIPVPSEEACKLAYLEIERCLAEGTISMKDTIEQRIDFLLDLWSFDAEPRTVLALQWQREIVRQFYLHYLPPKDEPGVVDDEKGDQ